MPPDKRSPNLPAAVLALALSVPVPCAWAEDPCALCSGPDCSADPCQCQAFPSPPRCPWYFQADGIMLRRDIHGSTPIATLHTDHDIVLSTHDLDMTHKAGGRFLVGRTLGDSPLQLEFSYFWTDNWDASAEIRDTSPNVHGGQGNLYSPFTGFGTPAAVRGVDYNDYVAVRETSTLENGELNIRRLLPTNGSRLTTYALLGVRYMSIDEGFHYYSHAEVSETGVFGATNSVNTLTRNQLWGPQIGALMAFYVEDRWWINFEAKAAFCGNAAWQRTEYVRLSESPAWPGPRERSRTTTTFIGDLDLSLVYRWTPRWTTRIGYQAIWIEGLALASENFDQTLAMLENGPAQLRTSGKTVYHGMHAGLELTW